MLDERGSEKPMEGKDILLLLLLLKGVASAFVIILYENKDKRNLKITGNCTVGERAFENPAVIKV